MKHMFELFHSTKGKSRTGLGLAVAKKIVDEHEGTISVKSAPGEGTKLHDSPAGLPHERRGPVAHARTGAVGSIV